MHLVSVSSIYTVVEWIDYRVGDALEVLDTLDGSSNFVPTTAQQSDLENAAGIGALLWTGPVDEQVIDLFHKGVYAFVAGAVADCLIR